MRVLIIGAGLGGLTLLHGLRRAGIDARVYERSARSGRSNPPATASTSTPTACAPCTPACPPRTGRRIDAAGVPAPLIIRFHDPHRGVLATIDKRFPEHATDPVTKRRAISRGKLRDALLHGTARRRGPLVHWGKTFTRYELHDDGVRAFFADGTHADGDILVGADGSNSRVRHQRLPDLQRQDLGIVNIAGRVPLAGAVGDRAARRTRRRRHQQRRPRPDRVDVPVHLGRRRPRRRRRRRYVVWAWAAAETSYPPGVRDLDGASSNGSSPNASRTGRHRCAPSSTPPTRRPSPPCRCGPCRTFPSGHPRASPSSATPSTT